MARVDLTALRLSVYELKYEESIPTKVSINEAWSWLRSMEGMTPSPFVNGILGKAASELR